MNEKSSHSVQDIDPPESSNEQDLSVTLAAANFRSIVFAIPPVILVFALYILFWGWPRASFGRSQLLWLVGLFLVGIVIHEGVHGLVWALWGTRSFSTIRFGMNLKALAPYAHATVPMKAGAYRLGAVSPALVLGVIPSLLGLLTGSLLATLFGILFLAAAAGDFLILWLIRHVPSDSLVKDHPTKAGCVVLVNHQ